MSDKPAGRIELIELIDEERIVPHGTRRIEWFVRAGSGWLRAARIPGARSEPLDAGPGTVWQVRTELRLPVSTRIMRRDTFPSAPSNRDALSYLTGGRHAANKVARTYYRLERRGELVKESH